jgi:hypothetical protein
VIVQDHFTSWNQRSPSFITPNEGYCADHRENLSK